MVVSVFDETLSVGRGGGEGVLINWPTIVTKEKKVTENAVANFFPAWLTFDQLLASLKILGASHPHVPPSAHPWVVLAKLHL